MDLLELLKRRYSVRMYKPVEVEQEKIDYILECARLAPSAVNKQPWRFIVVKSEAGKDAVRASYKNPWFATAPCYILVVVNENLAWNRTNYDNRNFAMVDGAIAAEHVCLAAEAMELGTCWVCSFDVNYIGNWLGLKEGEMVLAMFPIGYADDKTPRRPGRKPLDEVTEEV